MTHPSPTRRSSDFLRQIKRQQVDQAVEADDDAKAEHAAGGEVEVAEGLQVDDRVAVGQAAPEEQHGADSGGDGEVADRLVAEPVIAGAFLDDVFEAAEEQADRKSTRLNSSH